MKINFKNKIDKNAMKCIAVNNNWYPFFNKVVGFGNYYCFSQNRNLFSQIERGKKLINQSKLPKIEYHFDMFVHIGLLSV